MSGYPEPGQICFGNPVGEHPCPRWVDALVLNILSEIERVFWNKNQRQWDNYEDPHVPGIEFHSYYWGDDDFDEAEAAKPNLKHGDIEVRWYKRPMRGSSLNVEATPEIIIPWFESAIAAICAAEERK